MAPATAGNTPARPSTRQAGRLPARLAGLPLAIGLQALNSAGDGLAMVALANRVYQASHASWTVAAVFLAATIPVTILAPVAGLVLDRLPVRRALVAAGAAEALIALALVWVSGIVPTLVLATGFGLCAALLTPGLSAIAPRLAGDVPITLANSYLQAATWAGYTVGPLLAGVLISVSGSGAALAADAALYALSSVGLAIVRMAPRQPVAATAPGPADAGHGAASRPEPGRAGRRDRKRPRRGGELRAGFTFLRSDTQAGVLVLIVGIMVGFANMAVVAEVVFAEHVLNAGASGYALLTAGWTAGMIVGTLGGGRLGSRWLIPAALAGTVVTGLGIATAGVAATLWQAVAAYATGGVANGLETVATRSFLNLRVPPEVAGRVFAVYSGAAFGGVSAGMVVAAMLLPALGARLVLVVSGGGGLLTGVVGTVIFLLRYGRGRNSRRGPLTGARVR